MNADPAPLDNDPFPLPEGDKHGGTIFTASSCADPLFGRLNIAKEYLGRLSEWPKEASLLYRDGEGETVLAALIGDRIIVSRVGPADVVISEPHLSKSHFEVAKIGNNFKLSDLGSRNGTYLNGERWDYKETLSDGDCIEAGGVLFIFVKGA